MEEMPNCLQCGSEYTYSDGHMFICPMCGFEWTQAETQAMDEAKIVRDASGNELKDGDAVTVIKDLKLSATQVIKQGTKVKSIRILEESVNDHDIECKIDGIGNMYLKSQVVKKLS